MLNILTLDDLKIILASLNYDIVSCKERISHWNHVLDYDESNRFSYETCSTMIKGYNEQITLKTATLRKILTVLIMECDPAERKDFEDYYKQVAV